jgi:2'-5' RNA ligase
VSTPRTAVIVPVPAAAPVVDGWRERTCNAKPSLGVPPHITLLFPFVTPMTDDLLRDLRSVFIVQRFTLVLRSIDRFPGVAYLVPEPAAPFTELTGDLVRRYPDHPPYGGESFPVVPHLTIAQGGEEVLDRAAADVTPALPIVTEVVEALLIEEGVPWQVVERFPFSG